MVSGCKTRNAATTKNEGGSSASESSANHDFKIGDLVTIDGNQWVWTVSDFIYRRDTNEVERVWTVSFDDQGRPIKKPRALYELIAVQPSFVKTGPDGQSVEFKAGECFKLSNNRFVWRAEGFLPDGS